MPVKIISIALAAALAAPSLAAPPASPTYAVGTSIPGPDGGWDYAKVDPAAHRLYVARATAVTVIDTQSGKVLGSIGALSRGHAVVPLGAGGLLVTSGNDASARFLDIATGRELAVVTVGKKPDAAVYDAAAGRAYVMNADSGSISVIDVAARKVVRTIAVKPGLEFAALASDGTLFVNDEDASEIETVDVARGIMGKPIALPGCEAPSGLAYDAKTDRLISACDNGKAAIVDAKRRMLVALVDIGRGPDAVILDAERRLAFIPCGKDGVLDVLSLDGPEVTRIARVVTERGARTGALDPVSGDLYLPTARFAATPGADGRPVTVPGSFHVLVVHRKG